MKYLYIGIVVVGLAAVGVVASRFSGPSPNVAQAPTATVAPKAEDLIIYHAEGRRSQRIVWLCEELGIPYTLVFKRGDVGGSFATIRDINPAMPVAPTIIYKGHMMVESGAIIDFLQREFGNGRLIPPKDLPDLMYHYQFLHWSEGSALPAMFAEGTGGRYPIGPNKETVAPRPTFRLGTEDMLRFMEDHLSKHPYFGGQEFTTADMMMHFIASLAPDPMYFAVDMSKYPHFSAWQQKVESRPGYIQAMNAALPDHQENQCRIPACMPAQQN